MTGNLNLWNRFADIDPKHTKKITGKQYQGTSPNPQYVIRCLTELFGPVGEGFGWDVVAEEFTPLGQEVLHWCRIRFWHTDRSNSFESYGQTRACYTTNAGKVMVDEDAPKKSLTDAIVKAASYTGVAANIFLGRWDDQKYVAEVNADYRNRDAGTDFEALPQRQERQQRNTGPDPVQIAINSLNNAETIDALAAIWKGENFPRSNPEVIEAKEARKAALSQPADSVTADMIPY